MRAKIPACSSVTCSTCLCADARGPSASSVTGPADGGSDVRRDRGPRRPGRRGAGTARAPAGRSARGAAAEPARVHRSRPRLRPVRRGAGPDQRAVSGARDRLSSTPSEADRHHRRAARSVPAGSPVADVDELMREAEDGDGRRARPAIDGDAGGHRLHSGTTGRSKGAVLTHNNFAANAAAILTCWRITSADRYLAVLPLFHVHGLGNGVCVARLRLPHAPHRAVRDREGARMVPGLPADALLRRRRSTSACWSWRLTMRGRSGNGRGCSCPGRRRSRHRCSSSSASDSAMRSWSATG